MRDQTIENSGCEGEYSNCDSNAVFFPFIIQTLVTIEHTIAVSDFISDTLNDFSLSIKR